MPDDAKIIVISGIQGAGKSTIGPLLAARFERSVFIDADDVASMIVNGQAWATETAGPGDQLSEETTRQLRLRLHNSFLLARSYRDAGFTTVVGDIIVGDRWDHVRDDLAGEPFYLVVLAPDVETVIARDAARHKTVGPEWGYFLDTELRKTMAGVGLWIDTSHQSPEESVDEILRRLDEGLIESD
jgi:adenylylsulfate kinase-like enzyme